MEANLSIANTGAVSNARKLAKASDCQKQMQHLQTAMEFLAQMIAKITKLMICEDEANLTTQTREIKLLAQRLCKHGNCVLDYISQYCHEQLDKATDMTEELNTIAQMQPIACAPLNNFKINTEHIDAMFSMLLSMRSMIDMQQRDEAQIQLFKAFQNLIFCLRFVSSSKPVNENLP